MDFTKFLKHCEAEHGIHVDTSAFTKEILNSIFAFFAAHGEILTHTQLWDIFETLQESPKPGNPPPIVAEMKQRAFEYIGRGEPTGLASWRDEYGVLLSNEQALQIVEFCERVNVVEQLLEPIICFRPDWKNIDQKFNYVAVDASHDVYAFAEKPQFKSRGVWQDGGESEYLHEINFGKMIWERPKNNNNNNLK